MNTRDRVLEYLDSQKQEVSAATVALAVGVSQFEAQQALQSLVDLGQADYRKHEFCGLYRTHWDGAA